MSWICVARRARLSLSKPSALVSLAAADFNRNTRTPRLLKLVRTGTVPRYLFLSHGINCGNIILAVGFDRLDKLGTGGLNQARGTTALALVVWPVGGLILNLLCWCLLVFAARGLLFTAHG